MQRVLRVFRGTTAMTSAQTNVLVQHLRGLVGAQGTELLTDRELLRRFVHDQDEQAFAALVHRHGPMVLRVGRRLLRHEQDAEDVFQAAFLVLARKAHSTHWQPSIGNWLYGVAHRRTLEVRTRAARLRNRVAGIGPRQVADPLDEGALEAVSAMKLKLAWVVLLMACLAGAGAITWQAAAEHAARPGAQEGAPPAAQASPEPSVPAPRVRTDRYGDRLPPGAIRRLARRSPTKP
jgi:DNA-directed RNA polymerase specialized sigma24 family protein